MWTPAGAHQVRKRHRAFRGSFSQEQALPNDDHEALGLWLRDSPWRKLKKNPRWVSVSKRKLYPRQRIFCARVWMTARSVCGLSSGIPPSRGGGMNMAATPLSDTAASGLHRAEKELLKQRKKKNTEQSASPQGDASAPSSNSDVPPVICTRETDAVRARAPSPPAREQARQAAMKQAVKTKNAYISAQGETAVTSAPESQRQGQQAFIQEQGRKASRQQAQRRRQSGGSSAKMICVVIRCVRKVSSQPAGAESKSAAASSHRRSASSPNRKHRITLRGSCQKRVRAANLLCCPLNRPCTHPPSMRLRLEHTLPEKRPCRWPSGSR